MTSLKFDELNLSKELTKAIADLGFEEATPIQSQSIPHLMQGKDLIGQAQTGTGKTAAFGIPVIEKINTDIKETQAIVLCPTRELAVQVAEGLSDLIKYKKGIRIIPIYGGQSIERQINALRKGVQIIIATPGRLIDHLERKTIDFKSVNTVVLDEADEMLNMGFRDDMETILKKVPKERQTIFFSATMPKPILELSRKYLKNPEHIKVVHKELTVPNVQQFYYELKPGMKLEVLTRLIDVHNPKLSLVFCNTKRAVDGLVSHLQARGYLADSLHGDLKQNQRDRVMDKFRSGKLEILVATDVAARGIDVDDIDAVFNYDMPQDEEYYVHRIGRTARAGRTGQSHTFVAGKEFHKIKDIERFTKSKVIRKDIPSTEDVAELRTSSFIDEIKAAIGDGTANKKYEHYIEKLIEEDYTTYEIAGALIKILLAEKEAASSVQEKSYKESYSDSKPSFKDRKDRNKKWDKPDKFKKDKFKSDRFSSDKFKSDKFESGKFKSDKFESGKFDRDKFKKDKGSKKDNAYKRDEKPEAGMVRLYVNAGKKNNIQAGDIVGSFTGEAGIPSSSIGVIDIYDKFTFVDVKSKVAGEVIDSMNNNQIKGRTVTVQEAKGKQ